MAKFRHKRDVIGEATEGGVLDAAALMNILSPMGREDESQLALMITERPRRSAAPRPSARQQDEYADWFSHNVLPRLESGEISRESLSARERAALEMMEEIDELQQKLTRHDTGGDIKL